MSCVRLVNVSIHIPVYDSSSLRLLRLPSFLVGGNEATPADWRDGLRLTAHFLARDAFGHQHRPLPPARQMLYDRVAALAESDTPTSDTQMTGARPIEPRDRSIESPADHRSHRDAVVGVDARQPGRGQARR